VTWGAAIQTPRPEKSTLDVTAVARPGGARDERFISLGVFLLKRALLP
jgi:hypothetical protein